MHYYLLELVQENRNIGLQNSNLAAISTDMDNTSQLNIQRTFLPPRETLMLSLQKLYEIENVSLRAISRHKVIGIYFLVAPHSLARNNNRLTRSMKPPTVKPNFPSPLVVQNGNQWLSKYPIASELLLLFNLCITMQFCKVCTVWLFRSSGFKLLRSCEGIMSPLLWLTRSIILAFHRNAQQNTSIHVSW